MCKTTYSPVGRNRRIPDHANMLVHCQMVAKGFGKARQQKKKTVHVYIWKCCRIRAQSLLLGRSCTRTFLLRAMNHALRGWFWSTSYFVSWFFYDRICFSIEIPFQKWRQVVIQVVNNRKIMAKTPREANLYGNRCVRKGLILINLDRSKTARRRPRLIRLVQVWSMMSPVSFADPNCTYVKIKVLLVIRLFYQEVGDARLARSAKWQRVTSLEGCTPTDHESTLWLLVQYFHGNFSVCWKEE